MRLSNKTIALVLCIILCTSMTALGTVAYFTDRDSVTNTFTVGKVQITVDESKIDTNSGDVLVKVDIDGNGNFEDDNDNVMTKTEAETNHAGKSTQTVRTESGNEETNKNQYKLIPGAVYTKDPQMTVKAGSEESFVRMVVTINCAKELKALDPDFLPEKYVEDWDSTVWPCVKIDDLSDKEANTVTYYFNHVGTVSGLDENGNALTEDVKLSELFTEIKIPTNLTQEQAASLAGLEIKVEGHAIQAATFEGSAEKAWAAFDDQEKPATNP